MDTVVRLTNKPSDNFFAEMLLKALADHAGGTGTTAGGAPDRPPLRRAARRRGANLVDGSGLSRGQPRLAVRGSCACSRL